MKPRALKRNEKGKEGQKPKVDQIAKEKKAIDEHIDNDDSRLPMKKVCLTDVEEKEEKKRKRNDTMQQSGTAKLDDCVSTKMKRAHLKSPKSEK